MWRKRLEPFVAEWRDRDSSLLLRGGLLAEAERWLVEGRQDLDTTEREFIEASSRQQEREKQVEAEREQALVHLSLTAKRNEEKALRNLAASLAAQSAAVRGKFPLKSVLLASESVLLFVNNLIPINIGSEQSLRDSLQTLGGLGLVGHGGRVSAVAISPDGRWLATGSEHKTARLWDLTAGEPGKTARVLGGYEGYVDAVAVSPDGRWLATWDDVGTARLWPLTVEDLLQQAERTVGRNFARQEWEELFPGEVYRKTFPRLPDPPP